ncbi:MAG: S8 family serine peptidase [Bacillota bacterium]|nr:S8 family serine peptidase [Bacillota bacterium]
MKAYIKITLLMTCICILLIQTNDDNVNAFGETNPDEYNYQNNEIIVSFNKDVETKEAENITDGTIDHVIDSDQDDTVGSIESGTPVLINTDDMDIEKLANKLTEEKIIDYAQPNYCYVTEESYEDESVILDEDALTRAQWNMNYMDVYEAWNLIDALDIGGSNKIGIATIDTGVAQTHEDMQINLDKEKCFQTVSGEVKAYTPVYGHGTKTTSLIAADSNNGIGIDGIASGNNNDLASVFGINVFENKGRKRQYSASTSDIIAVLVN